VNSQVKAPSEIAAATTSWVSWLLGALGVALLVDQEVVEELARLV
jgi:hypothetical protein